MMSTSIVTQVMLLINPLTLSLLHKPLDIKFSHNFSFFLWNGPNSVHTSHGMSSSLTINVSKASYS